MAFSFEHFSRGLAQTADNLSAGIMRNYERKESERIQIEAEKRRRVGALEDKKEIMHLTKKLNKEAYDYQMQQKSLADSFGGNILVMKQFVADSVSMNKEKQMKAVLVKGLFGKLGMGEELNKEDAEFLKSLDLITQNTLTDLHLGNKKYNQELQIRKAQVADIAETRKLGRQNAQALLEERTWRKVQQRNAITAGFKQDVRDAEDIRDKAYQKVLDAVKEKNLLLYDKVSKKWLSRQFTKRVSIFDEDRKITTEARAAILKKHPEFSGLFEDLDKFDDRLDQANSAWLTHAQGRISEEKVVEKTVGKTYVDGSGNKAIYGGKDEAGKDIWEIVK